MRLLFADNAITRIAAPVASGDGTITVTTGAGALFPSPAAGEGFRFTMTSAGDATYTEITTCTSRTGDVLTITRAQEGTTAKTFAVNDPCGNLWTAGSAQAMAQGPSDTYGTVSMVQVYAGDPNTHVAGSAGVVGVSAPSQVWDTTNRLFWVCTASGSAGAAVWAAVTTPGSTTYCGTSTGSANTQVVTPAVSVTLVAGLSLAFIAGFTNSNAMTLNASGTGAKNVYKESSTGPIPLAGGEVVAGNLVTVRYDGTQHQLTATELGTAALANASSITGTVAAVTGAFTVGHIAVASDTAGTLQDGGLPGAAGAPTYLNFSNNGQTMGSGVFSADTTTGSGGAFTVNLPAIPAAGTSSLTFGDLYGTWDTNPLTLGRNGHTIMALAQDLVCSVRGMSFTLTYNGTDWRLS